MMFKRLSRKSLLLALVVVLPTLTYLGYRVYEYQTYSNFKVYTGETRIKRFKFIRDKKAVAIEWEDPNPADTKKLMEMSGKAVHRRNSGVLTVDDDYLLTTSLKLKSIPTEMGNESYPTKREWGEYWYVDIYDMSKQQIDPDNFRRIDIFQAVKDFAPDYLPIDIDPLIVTHGASEKYLQVTVAQSKSSTYLREGTYEYAWLNLSSGEVVDITDGPFMGLGDYPDGFDFVLSDYLDQMKIWSFSNVISFTESPNPRSSDWKIAETDPEVLDILNKGGGLYLLKSGTDMDFTASLLQEFVPEGQDIFDGVTVPADYSVDGQEHIVHSYDEFKRYYSSSETESESNP